MLQGCVTGLLWDPRKVSQGFGFDEGSLRVLKPLSSRDLKSPVRHSARVES